MNQPVNLGNEKWSRASLRVFGDTLQPDRIGAMLGLESTLSHLKGERVSTRNDAVRRTSLWLLQCPLDDHLPLQAHLIWLLDLVEPKAELINLIGQDYSVDFFCGFSSENGQGGAEFDRGLLRRLANLGVPLILDLYPPQAIQSDV